jgi:hypothetical protein
MKPQANLYFSHYIEMDYNTMNDIIAATKIEKKSTRYNKQKDNTYKVYQVFALPCITTVSDTEGRLLMPPRRFVELCLEQTQLRNQQNILLKQQRSSDYFTSLNHAERYRIPLAIRRFNNNFQTQQFGLMSFIVARGEHVKNKVYNQRISSINAELLDISRVSEIIYPINYQLQHPTDFSSLGSVISVPNEGFNLVRVSDQVLGEE